MQMVQESIAGLRWRGLMLICEFYNVVRRIISQSYYDVVSGALSDMDSTLIRNQVRSKSSAVSVLYQC